jgi:hypothetical protein
MLTLDIGVSFLNYNKNFMQQNMNSRTAKKRSIAGVNYTYLIFNISLIFILPVLSTTGEFVIGKLPITLEPAAKWFIFWAIGIRLFVAGIKQASSPEFTATKLFNLKSAESYVIIRELGFANISLGVMGILSVINDDWRLIAAITGGLYLGFAGLQHCLKKPESLNEVVALIYDLIVFILISLYLILKVTLNIGN